MSFTACFTLDLTTKSFKPKFFLTYISVELGLENFALGITNALTGGLSAVIDSGEFADLVQPVLCINQTHSATA